MNKIKITVLNIIYVTDALIILIGLCRLFRYVWKLFYHPFISFFTNFLKLIEFFINTSFWKLCKSNYVNFGLKLGTQGLNSILENSWTVKIVHGKLWNFEQNRDFYPPFPTPTDIYLVFRCLLPVLLRSSIHMS